MSEFEHVPHKHGCVICGKPFDCPCPAKPGEYSNAEEAELAGWPILCPEHEADAANGRRDWSEFDGVPS